LKESLAKSQAENAQLRGDAPPPTTQANNQEPPPASANGKAGHKKTPKSPATQRPASPQPALAPEDEGMYCRSYSSILLYNTFKGIEIPIGLVLGKENDCAK
jgi:hypothetical protein